MSLAILNNEITEAKYKSRLFLHIVLEGDAKVEHGNKWRKYRERISHLDKKRGYSFSMIRGQCIHLLPYMMRHDPDWDNTSESYNPLTLLELFLEKNWLRPKINFSIQQTNNPEWELYGLYQHNLTNEEFYERFNTKFDVGEDIGITRQHCVIMVYTAQ